MSPWAKLNSFLRTILYLLQCISFLLSSPYLLTMQSSELMFIFEQNPSRILPIILLTLIVHLREAKLLVQMGFMMQKCRKSNFYLLQLNDGFISVGFGNEKWELNVVQNEILRSRAQPTTKDVVRFCSLLQRWFNSCIVCWMLSTLSPN